MAPILTAEDVVRRIAAECAHVDNPGWGWNSPRTGRTENNSTAGPAAVKTYGPVFISHALVYAPRVVGERHLHGPQELAGSCIHRDRRNVLSHHRRSARPPSTALRPAFPPGRATICAAFFRLRATACVRGEHVRSGSRAVAHVSRAGQRARLHRERRTHARTSARLAAACAEQGWRSHASARAKRRCCAKPCDARCRTVRCTVERVCASHGGAAGSGDRRWDETTGSAEAALDGS